MVMMVVMVMMMLLLLLLLLMMMMMSTNMSMSVGMRMMMLMMMTTMMLCSKTVLIRSLLQVGQRCIIAHTTSLFLSRQEGAFGHHQATLLTCCQLALNKCWSCALCFRNGSLKKSVADVFAWNKCCWKLLGTLYKVCMYATNHTEVAFCVLSAHKQSLAEIVAIKRSVGRLLKRNEFAFYLNADSHRSQRCICLCSSC